MGMKLPELIRYRATTLLSTFCEARVPHGVRHKVRLSHRIRGASITLFEERAPWKSSDNPTWTKSPVAQFRYDGNVYQWTLYWCDRNRRWHLFSDAEPTQEFGELIDVVGADVTGIFWG